MTLEEISVAVITQGTRLDDHIRQCEERDRKRAGEMTAFATRLDGAYNRMWVIAGATVTLLLSGLVAVIILVIKHMMDTHG